jgi:hypothetical protein
VYDIVEELDGVARLPVLVVKCQVALVVLSLGAFCTFPLAFCLECVQLRDDGCVICLERCQPLLVFEFDLVEVLEVDHTSDDVEFFAVLVASLDDLRAEFEGVHCIVESAYGGLFVAVSPHLLSCDVPRWLLDTSDVKQIENFEMINGLLPAV